MNEYVLVLKPECDRATLEKLPYAIFFRQPVTPAAPWSFMLGTLMILVNVPVTGLDRLERVSSSPKEVDVDIRIRIVARDGTSRLFRCPDMHARRHESVVVHAVHLVPEALVDPDLLRLHTYRAQVPYDFRPLFQELT